MDTDYPRAQPQVGNGENMRREKIRKKKDDLVTSVFKTSLQNSA